MHNCDLVKQYRKESNFLKDEKEMKDLCKQIWSKLDEFNKKYPLINNFSWGLSPFGIALIVGEDEE